MFKLTSLTAVVCLTLLPACSDDVESGKDMGTKKDQAPVSFPDNGQTGDQGPAADKGVTDDVAQAADMPVPLLVEEYVPANNAIADWVEDTSVGAPGVEAAYTDEDIDDIIDGSHDPYATEGCKGFAKQEFINGAGDTLSLFIWDMNTAAGAKNMFDKNEAAGPDNGLTYEEIPSVTEKGIIANVGPSFKGYFHKSTYIAKFDAKVASGGELAPFKALVITFVQQLSGTLP